jgi:hypothetical protein
VAEVADAGEDHRQTEAVGIAGQAAGLNERCDAVPGGFYREIGGSSDPGIEEPPG